MGSMSPNPLRPQRQSATAEITTPNAPTPAPTNTPCSRRLAPNRATSPPRRSGQSPTRAANTWENPARATACSPISASADEYSAVVTLNVTPTTVTSVNVRTLDRTNPTISAIVPGIWNSQRGLKRSRNRRCRHPSRHVRR